MREEDAVHLIPGFNAWMVTRWKDVRELFTHPSTTNDRRAYENYNLPPEGSAARWFAENSLFAVEPERHARMRNLVSAALTPRAVKRMEGQVREVVGQFAQKLRGTAQGPMTGKQEKGAAGGGVKHRCSGFNDSRGVVR